MSLKSLSIPDQFPEIGIWMDDLLVSSDLIDAIVQLEVLAGDRLTKVQSLDGILAGSPERVVTSGLAGANESTLRALLRQPSLLLELQERVMMHGGEYWQQKVDANFGNPRTTSIFDSASSGANTDVEEPTPHAIAASQSYHGPAVVKSNANQKIIFGVLATLAAAALIMISLPQFGGGSSVAKANWGFAKSGLLESNISESEMLDQLAAASAAWHNKTPATRDELADRLRAFDQGCGDLLASRLTQLSPINRDAVHAACEDCREAIAQQLAALADGGDITRIQSNADAAIDTLTRAIERLT